jgi:hypothetical protein
MTTIPTDNDNGGDIMEQQQPPVSGNSRRKRRTKIYLIVTTILYLLSLVPAALAIMMTPFAFDEGATPEAWALVTKILVYPLVVIISVVGSWIFYRLSWFWVAIAWSLLPIVNILLIFT